MRRSPHNAAPVFWRGNGPPPLPARTECLSPDFISMATGMHSLPSNSDKLRSLQLRDIAVTKIPRALRFNDRISMRSSVELREPFLDHRLVELALAQPPTRKISGGETKVFLRQLVQELLPEELRLAPKRPIQTPQREWLRGPLREWATSMIETGKGGIGVGWLNPKEVDRLWSEYCETGSDNSYFVWQWISLGLCTTFMNQRAVRQSH